MSGRRTTGPIGRKRDVVGRVEALALKMREEGRGFTGLVGAADAAPPMLAMDEPPISIDGVAVDEIRGVDHCLDVSVWIPSKHPAAVDIGPDEPLAGRVPDDAFAERGVLVEAKQRRVGSRTSSRRGSSMTALLVSLSTFGGPGRRSRVPVTLVSLIADRSTALFFRGAPKVSSSSARRPSAPRSDRSS